VCFRVGGPPRSENFAAGTRTGGAETKADGFLGVTGRAILNA